MCESARIVRMKRQRNKRHEAVRLVLQFAQLHEMIHALFFGLHMAVEHGGVRTQSNFMRFPRDVEPHLAADFVVANNLAHARMKNLRAAAGQESTPASFMFAQRFFDGKLRDAREIVHLDHRERLQVHARAALFQPANHLQKIFERQIGMQAADDVKFGGAFAHALFRALVNFFQSKGVSAGSVRDRGQRRTACNAPRRRWSD